jgi:hypothetical protein
VAQRQLLRLDRAARGAAEGRFSLTMEIRLYRDKLASGGDDPRQRLIGKLWQAVAAQLAAPAAGAAKVAGAAPVPRSKVMQ